MEERCAKDTWYHMYKPVISLLPIELLPSPADCHGEKNYTVSMGEFKDPASPFLRVTVRLDSKCFYIRPVEEIFKEALLAKNLNIDSAKGVTLSWSKYGMQASLHILRKLKAGNHSIDETE